MAILRGYREAVVMMTNGFRRMGVCVKMVVVNNCFFTTIGSMVVLCKKD